jgi:hypothetical protein
MTTFPANQIEPLLNDAGIWTLDTWVKDALYTPVSSPWILGPLKTAWPVFLTNLGIVDPEEEDGDCDDYAVWLIGYVSALHRRTPGRPKPYAALALGMLWFIRDIDHKKHVASFCIALENEKLIVKFLEPQPNAYGFFTLSETELETVGNVYI